MFFRITGRLLPRGIHFWNAVNVAPTSAQTRRLGTNQSSFFAVVCQVTCLYRPVRGGKEKEDIV